MACKSWRLDEITNKRTMDRKGKRSRDLSWGTVTSADQGEGGISTDRNAKCTGVKPRDCSGLEVKWTLKIRMRSGQLHYRPSKMIAEQSLHLWRIMISFIEAFSVDWGEKSWLKVVKEKHKRRWTECNL